MGLSILSYVQILQENNLEDFKTVIDSIQDRLDWYDDREPDSYGTVHDNWEEKRDDTETLLEELQDLYDEIEDNPDNFTKEVIAQIQELLKDYQAYTGGLSRWF